MNIAGSKLDAYAIVTMETSSAFLRNSKRTVFLNDGLAKYDVICGVDIQFNIF